MAVGEATGQWSTLSALMHQLARFSDVPPEVEPPLVCGDLIGDRYRVGSLLGRGGMGFVYEAYDETSGVPCALKTVRAMAPERILLLKNEFRTLARVRHPNLVHPGELLEEGGRWFFTMELVRGTDPIQWAQGKDSRVRHVIGGVADVLAVMHANGVMHRDIKPSNILVDSDERVVVLDLGLARNQRSPLWFDSGIAGTTMYRAPEQNKQDAVFGPAADMYALGVLLHELATGHVPATEPAGADSALPPELDEVCRELLDVDPAARPDAATLARRWCTRPTTELSRSPLFVGRDAEVARLHIARDRGARAIFVHGSAGIGKTSLVEHWLDECTTRGAIVLRGRCYEREKLPYKAVDGVMDALASTIAERPHLAATVTRTMRDVFPSLRRCRTYPSPMMR